MGQTLSSPDTEKHSDAGQDDRFLFGVSEMQGWRISMEDAHAIELNLEAKSGGHNAFFAVYDGHGGGTVARFSGQNVHKRLINEPTYAQHQWKDALKHAFLGTDDDIRAVIEQQFFRDPSGCTAVAALVTDDGWIVVANAGDSRAVLSIKGEVLPLSYDHKPANESELLRIRNAGGYVEYGRVNGNLALSRAIGDFEFKKNAALSPEEQIITANPDVTEHKITEEDEFFVLACDGIWDCLTSQQVVDIVRLQVSQRRELTQIAEFLCDHCLAPDTTSGAGIGCDNMTVLIVAILNGRTKEQWYDWMEDRVKRKYGYPTPAAVPQLWSASRINAFHARRAAQEERRARDLLAKDESGSEEGSDNGVEGGLASVFGGRALGPGGALSGFARSMLGTGITFHPSSGINSDDGTLMFAPDDSDEESDDEMDTGDGPMSEGDLFDENTTEHQFLTALGLRPPVSDMTKSLRAQLEELEESDEHPARSRTEVVDGTTSPKEQGSPDGEDNEEDNEEDEGEDDEDNFVSNPGDEAQQAFGAAQKSKLSNGISTKVVGSNETPPPPASLVNGDIKVKQLSSTPGGDEAPPVVKAEGLMDGSESPFKG